MMAMHSSNIMAFHLVALLQNGSDTTLHKSQLQFAVSINVQCYHLTSLLAIRMQYKSKRDFPTDSKSVVTALC